MRYVILSIKRLLYYCIDDQRNFVHRHKLFIKTRDSPGTQCLVYTLTAVAYTRVVCCDQQYRANIRRTDRGNKLHSDDDAIPHFHEKPSQCFHRAHDTRSCKKRQTLSLNAQENIIQECEQWITLYMAAWTRPCSLLCLFSAVGAARALD